MLGLGRDDDERDRGGDTGADRTEQPRALVVVCRSFGHGGIRAFDRAHVGELSKDLALDPIATDFVRGWVDFDLHFTNSLRTGSSAASLINSRRARQIRSFAVTIDVLTSLETSAIERPSIA